MGGKNQWVSPRSDGTWVVQSENNQRATAVYDTQREAQARAIEIAKNQKSEVIVQGKDGRIRSKDLLRRISQGKLRLLQQCLRFSYGSGPSLAFCPSAVSGGFFLVFTMDSPE